MISSLKHKLQHLLKLQLPGNVAQNKMSPLKRDHWDYYKNSYPQKGAVLVLLYMHGASIHTVAILRQQYNGVHSGQISFPGGKQEPNEDLEKTALREAKEELGIVIEDVEIIGSLTNLYIPVSNFIVQPYLGVLNGTPSFKPDNKEVAKIIEINVNHLLDDATVKSKPIMISLLNQELDTAYYDLQQQTIWGATAMILSELKELLKQTGITFS